MNAFSARLLRLYLRIVGAALLLQGTAALTLQLTQTAPPDALYLLLRTDVRHALIHIFWGLLILGVLWWLQRQLTFPSNCRFRSPVQILRQLGLGFGSFYFLFGVVGVLFHHPFNMVLGLGENTSHLLGGAIALGFAARLRPQEILP